MNVGVFDASLRLKCRACQSTHREGRLQQCRAAYQKGQCPEFAQSYDGKPSRAAEESRYPYRNKRSKSKCAGTAKAIAKTFKSGDSLPHPDDAG